MVYSMITYDTHTPIRVGIDYTGGTTLQYGVQGCIDKSLEKQNNEVIYEVQTFDCRNAFIEFVGR